MPGLFPLATNPLADFPAETGDARPGTPTKFKKNNPGCDCCQDCCDGCGLGGVAIGGTNTPLHWRANVAGRLHTLKRTTPSPEADPHPFSCRWIKSFSTPQTVGSCSDITKLTLYVQSSLLALLATNSGDTVRATWQREQNTLIDCGRQHNLPWVSGCGTQAVVTAQPFNPRDPDCVAPNGQTNGHPNCVTGDPLPDYFRVWFEVPFADGSCSTCETWQADFIMSVDGLGCVGSFITKCYTSGPLAVCGAIVYLKLTFTCTGGKLRVGIRIHDQFDTVNLAIFRRDVDTASYDPTREYSLPHISSNASLLGCVASGSACFVKPIP
jgi:hypothetical protein